MAPSRVLAPVPFGGTELTQSTRINILRSSAVCASATWSEVSVVATDGGVGMETKSGSFVCVFTGSCSHLGVLIIIKAVKGKCLSPLCVSIQERFQVKSPPSTYLAKIKSFYLDQGGVSRRVSGKLDFLLHLLQHWLSYSWALVPWCNLYFLFRERKESKMPRRSLKPWRYPSEPITSGKNVELDRATTVFFFYY